MAFQVSPGVEVKEIDLTNVIPAVSTSIGGFAGYFEQGPVGQIKLIGSEKELTEVFGKPTNAFTAQSFFQAASFLKYGNALKVVRAGDVANAANSSAPTLKNAQEIATATSVTLLIPSVDFYEENFAPDSSAISGKGKFVARNPGSIGNSIEVQLINAPMFNKTAVGSSPTFNLGNAGIGFGDETSDARPIVAKFGSEISGVADLAVSEVHIIVIDRGGDITGTAGTVLETFEYVSTVDGAKKTDGTSNFIYDVLLQSSNHIFSANITSIKTLADLVTVGDASDNDAFATDYTVDSSDTTTAINYVKADGTTQAMTGTHVLELKTTLQDGGDVSATGFTSAANIVTALDQFVDAETEDVNLLFAAADANGESTIASKIITVCEGRKDCVGFISPPIDDSTSTQPLTDVLAFANGLTSSSYAVCDSTSLKVYDKYNDVFRQIASSGYTAGLCANADNVAEPWFSPAGFNRGQLLGVTKINYNPKKADRDELYKARVNPIVSFPGQGTVLFGDKTLQGKPSAFDRINVRRLFIVLEKAISTAAKFQLFELNDEFTRAMFRNMTEPFLRDVKGRRGITDFLVVCDETNNTGEVIDANRFVADIYIKPARSINFITLNFIATRTGVEFSEIVGK
jgi:phage tail sheath protein FI